MYKRGLFHVRRAAAVSQTARLMEIIVCAQSSGESLCLWDLRRGRAFIFFFS